MGRLNRKEFISAVVLSSIIPLLTACGGSSGSGTPDTTTDSQTPAVDDSASDPNSNSGTPSGNNNDPNNNADSDNSGSDQDGMQQGGGTSQKAQHARYHPRARFRSEHGLEPFLLLREVQMRHLRRFALSDPQEV